jgi:hypothetical protein
LELAPSAAKSWLSPRLSSSSPASAQGLQLRVTKYDAISIWEIDMRYRYGRSDVMDISMGLSIWDMCYQYEIWYIDLVIHHIDMVILGSKWDTVSSLASAHDRTGGSTARCSFSAAHSAV